MERGVHDRGGRPADGADRSQRAQLADWELLTDALVGALGRRGLMNVDELRRGIESMPPDEYERASYYERWLFSIETILTEKGVLAARRARSEGRGMRYRVGERGRGRRPSARGPPPHALVHQGQDRRRRARARTFRNPETRAYGDDGLPELPLYLVGFAQRELWPDYPRPTASDRVYVDVFEHWLEEAE